MTVGAAVALTLLGITGSADPPITMAPPTPPGFSQGADGAPADADANSVFQWMEIPQN